MKEGRKEGLMKEGRNRRKEGRKELMKEEGTDEGRN